jgi:hypothetical protein
MYRPKLGNLNSLLGSDYSLPKALIIGVQKAATTTIFRNLCDHPNLLGPLEKELHFFDYNQNYSRGVAYYKNQFPLNWKRKTLIEATPRYLYDQESAQRIKNTLGSEVKLIISLRDPIARAYSAWNMYLEQRNREVFYKSMENKNPSFRLYSEYSLKKPTFAEAVNQEIEWLSNDQNISEPSIVKRGFYKDQILHWMEYFDRSNFYFLNSEDLKIPKFRSKILSEIEIFLEVEPNLSKMVLYDHHVKQSKKPEIETEVNEKLKVLFNSKNKDLSEITGINHPWLN